MPSPLLPPTLTLAVTAFLAGRSIKAVRAALANGELPSLAVADVEGWLNREISPAAYLAAERSVDAYRAATRARVAEYRSA